jgi:hypothetical protein
LEGKGGLEGHPGEADSNISSSSDGKDVLSESTSENWVSVFRCIGCDWSSFECRGAASHVAARPSLEEPFRDTRRWKGNPLRMLDEIVRL